MDVIQMPMIILFIANHMFPKPSLPDSGLTLAGAGPIQPGRVMINGFHLFGKIRLDQCPTDRIIRIFRRQLPYAMQMIRQQHPCNNGKRALFTNPVYHISQRVAAITMGQYLSTPIRHHRKKEHAPGFGHSAVIRHPIFQIIISQPMLCRVGTLKNTAFVLHKTFLISTPFDLPRLCPPVFSTIGGFPKTVGTIVLAQHVASAKSLASGTMVAFQRVPTLRSMGRVGTFKNAAFVLHKTFLISTPFDLPRLCPPVFSTIGGFPKTVGTIVLAQHVASAKSLASGTMVAFHRVPTLRSMGRVGTFKNAAFVLHKTLLISPQFDLPRLCPPVFSLTIDRQPSRVAGTSALSFSAVENAIQQ